MEINNIEITRFVTIQWDKYFDRIYGLHHLPNVARKREIDEELAKVGMDTSPIFQWKYTYPTIFDTYIRERVECASPQFEQDDRKHIITNVTLAYYNIFQESLNRGFKKILVIEDDCSFICELCVLKDTLEHIPEDWDYIHFDKMLSICEYPRLAFSKKCNNHFRHYFGGFWGTALTAFSEKAMEVAIEILERHLTGSDSLLENNFEETPNTLHRYVPSAPICYQRNRIEAYTTTPV